MKYKKLSTKKLSSKLNVKKIIKLFLAVLILALLAREGWKEYTKLTDSGVLRESKNKDSEYDLGLGGVGSKHYEISTPENWKEYVHSSFMFYYPDSYHENNNEFTENNEARLAKNDLIATEYGRTTYSYLSIEAYEGNMLPRASLSKQVFLRDWKMGGGVSTITHLDRYSVNNRPVYHMAYRVDFNNYNPLQPTPFSQHTIYIQIDDRYYVLVALNNNLSSEEAFVEELLAIAASINSSGDIATAEHQLPLGIRKPKNVEEQLQLGSDLLEFTNETITFGDPEGEIMIISFVSTLSAENYPTIVGLSEYVSSHDNIGLRFEIIPVVDSNLNQYSYNDALLHCALLSSNLTALSGEITGPSDIPVDESAVASCLSSPNLSTEIHEKSTKAIDFGVIDTPVVTILYKGAWQADYYGWDEIEELLQELDSIYQSKLST